ncbi:branched-chain amino acid ABC transporter permease [Pseudorhizobium endolithicum]|uniref:Branched-chain amino acid ABC transporter permease n=1 Tax=Pseudorhizobium endolithicum TaxID=1191678 RepID=A0ABN7JEF0_9HYPH|nr:AzlC family ABC transporter permease [Pseudorhizobium endolithicum]CAD6412521.1 branched-chain amino acid ABC transporter permease [Rhizobium sp. Q54]CAD7023418.1 branched-chain amino acid ABC transporter permease [Pseudorhizobium endolithicum]
MSPSSDIQPAFFWFLSGMRGITSLPALILMTSFVGFSAFAFESGISRGEAIFMTISIWALPAKMILVGMMAGGAHIAACFAAVTLSSIRLMPMVASLVPEMRTSRTPAWLLLFLSHFIAITAWVFATQRLKDVPREHRAIFFAGFGITLTLTNTLIVAVCYGIVEGFPPLVSGALFMLTPVYFLASIWATARQAVVKLAFIIGVAAGPLMAVISPGFDVLYAGIGGGTAAYLIDRIWIRGRKREPQTGEQHGR